MLQQERLSALLRYAVAGSPFHRKRCGAIAGSNAIKLEDLPIMDKETMMEQFDEVVTDPRLKLKDLQKHLQELTQDDYYLGEYRVLSTSGSSGVPAVVVYDRRAWSTVMACMLRWSNFVGLKPNLRRRLRISAILAGSPIHATRRVMDSADFGFTRTQRLSAADRLDTLITSLNQFQPDVLSAYPSIASLLAIEQLEGRLHIRPRIVSTSSEMRTQEMERNIQQAWGIQPFNGYGLTEAIFDASDDTFHKGMHVFEDLVILEVVDQNNQPVTDGMRGEKVLLTNLYNYAQPVIRYEVSDMVTIATEPCSCGRSYRTIARIEGRNDDIIYLPGAHGGQVPVHAIHFEEAMSACHAVKEFQVIQEPTEICVRVVVRGRATSEETSRNLRRRLSAMFAALGVTPPELHVECVQRIERCPERMGKFKVIKSSVKRHSALGHSTTSTSIE